MVNEMRSKILSMEELDEKFAKLRMEGYWGRRPPNNEPQAVMEPYLWRWQDLHPLLIEAGRAVSTQTEYGERRTVAFMPPGYRGPNQSTHTLTCAIQLLQAGDVAAGHRHSMSALRFVVQGGDGYTVVQGRQFKMDTHDLILTPRWSWHDHANRGENETIWIDVIDSPLTHALDVRFWQPDERVSQPIDESATDLLESGAVRPLQGAVKHLGSAYQYHPAVDGVVFKYKGAEAMTSVKNLPTRELDQHDCLLLDYANPWSGGPTLPTMQCRLQRLVSGFQGRPHRHTSTTFYHVLEGEGLTIAGKDTIAGEGVTIRGGKEMKWKPGDTFMVPNWTWHVHANSGKQDAILFTVGDEPTLSALGFYYIENK